MIPGGPRSYLAVLTAIVTVFAVSLVGCASLGPNTPVAVSGVKSVAGTWKGVVYRRGFEPENVELTIRDDGSYDVVSLQTIGTSRGKGTITVRDGRLVFQGERGQGVGTLLRSPDGDRVMEVEATLSDNSTLSAKLSPSR